MSGASHHYLRWRGKQFGPFSRAEIEAQLDANEIGLWHEVQRGGEWVTVEQFLAELPPAPAPTPAPVSRPAPQAVRVAPVPVSAPLPEPVLARVEALPEEIAPHAEDSSVGALAFKARPRVRIYYIILGLLGGFFGVHNFYAGYAFRGIFQVLVSVALLILGWGIFLTWVWAWVEVLLVRRGPDGAWME